MSRSDEEDALGSFTWTVCPDVGWTSDADSEAEVESESVALSDSDLGSGEPIKAGRGEGLRGVLKAPWVVRLDEAARPL